jgi:hypothetical protein
LAQLDTNKYENKLKQDAGIIVLLLGLLYFSELYIAYNIMWLIRGAVPGISIAIGLNLVFLILVLGIETMGCVRVYQSIKRHMYEFEYYD